jgi:hypothetical protein
VSLLAPYDIVCFQETKLMVCLAILYAVYGVGVVWDNRVVEKIEECVGAYTVAVTFRNVVDHSVWAFAGVYGLNLDRDRRLLWDELAGVLSLWNLPCCLGGDFNVT